MKKGLVAIVSLLTGIVIGAGAVVRMENGKLKQMYDKSQKHFELFRMMSQWVKVKQEGKHLSSYLEENGYRKIAVYGISYAGEALINELKGTGIEIAYGIDRNADYISTDINIVPADAPLEEVDAIIVTAVTFFAEIQEKLCEKADCPIISLEDVLYGV